MNPHTVFLQPLGGTPDNPAPPQPSTEVPVAPAGDAGAPGFPPLPPEQTTTGATQELCVKANNEAVISTLGYGLGASLLALVLFVVLEKKLKFTPAARMGIALGVGSSIACALAFFDPVRADQFKLCLADPAMALYLTLGTQQAARALVLGFGPALLMTFLLCALAKRLA